MSWRPHGQGSPCPICAKADSWCVSTDDGTRIACRRIQRGDAEVREDRNGAEFYLYTRSGAEAAEFTPPEENWRETPAEPEKRDAAYRVLLDALPLEAAHLEQLRKRGLSGDWIHRAGYSTLPDDSRRESAVAKVEVECGYSLQVPGFFKRDASKTVRLGGVQGVLVPVRDVRGLVVACVIRADSPGKGGKYRWLSAPPGTIGCGPGSIAHVPLHEGEHKTVRVTEGQLKADVATALSGTLTIGLPGVSAWKLALEPLRALGAKRVLLAFDADARRNKDVARALARIAQGLAEQGFEVAIEVWPDDAGKGVDDAWAAGRGAEVEVHEGADAWSRIAEICAEAGTPKAPGVEARAELAEMVERVKADPALAFAEDFVGAAATLKEATPEFQRLEAALAEIKRFKTKLWRDAVRRVRREREQRERDKSLSADAWRQALVLDDEGKPKRGIANTMAVLALHPDWAGRLAFDEFLRVPVSRSRLPVRPLDDHGADDGGGEFVDTDATRIAAWFATNAGFEPSTEQVFAAVAAVAEKRRFHPVRDYLGALQWDGTPRLDSMLTDYFGAQDSPYVRAVSAKWMISAVARVTEPGCQVDCVLVLEGKQGRGKSTALRVLFGDDWFSDTGINIGDKDAMQSLRRKWCHEFAELDALKGKETSRVKAFVTSRVDRYRPSFGRVAQDFPRQIVFAGSTNEDRYLEDRTGNRRFWPVRCGYINTTGLGEVRGQLWAEAHVRYQRGERWYVDTSELKSLFEAEQRDRETIDPWVEKISKWLQKPTVPDGPGEYTGKPTLRELDLAAGVTTTDVLLGALPGERLDRTSSTRVGYALRDLGWPPAVQRRRYGARLWVHFPPGGAESEESPPDNVIDFERAKRKPELEEADPDIEREAIQSAEESPPGFYWRDPV